MVATYVATNGTVIVPLIGASNLCSIKTNFVNLIHQADLQVNGKTIESNQPFINVARHFQLLSEMSVNDLITIGHSLGCSPTIDNTKSIKKYNSTYATPPGTACSGNGLTNNRPYGGVSDNQTAFSTIQNTGVGIACGQYKCGKYYDTTSNDNGIVGTTDTIVTKANLESEFRPYYEVVNNYMVWYDFDVMKLSHLFQSLGKMELVRRFDTTLRIWVNTGTVCVTVKSPQLPVLNYALTPNNNSFSSTCPLLVNYIPSITTGGASGVQVTTVNIV
jgi:hypothetical protein